MSPRNRKIILWSSVSVLAIILLFFWAKSIPDRLDSFQGQDFFEGIEMPEIELPKIPEINYGEEISTTTE